MLATGWLVLALSTAFALVTEAISYFLVYRTDDYQTTKAELERQVRTVNKLKEEGASARSRKLLETAEASLTSLHREMTAKRFKSTMVMSLAFIGIMWYFHSAFAGVVVARLPFEPIGLMQGLSHRGLEGDDPRDCSFVFLYGMCTMAVRTIAQKALGFGLSRSASKINSFGPSITWHRPAPGWAADDIRI